MATIGDSTSESSPMKDDNTENLPAIAKDGTEPSEKASNSVMCGPVLREQLRIFGEIAANKANGKRVDEKESDENGAVGTNKPRNSWPNNKANNNNGKLQEESVENVKGLTNNSKSPGSKATQFRSSYLGFTVNFDHAEENSITSNAKDEEIGEEFQNKLTRGDNSQDDNKSSTASMPTAPQMKQRNNVGEIIGKRPAADRNNAQGKAIQDAICLPEQKITKEQNNDEDNKGKEVDSADESDVARYSGPPIHIGWPLKHILVLVVFIVCPVFISHLIDGNNLLEIAFDREAKHVLPSKEDWRIRISAKCRAGQGAIRKCVWKQLQPFPRNMDSPVLPDGTMNCLTISSKEIDATLANVKIPEIYGKYIFELTCIDDSNRTSQRFFVMVSEKPVPIVIDIKHHINISIRTGFVKLHADCRATRGNIDSKWWKCISAPENVGEIIVSENGRVEFPKAGVYKFQYKCNDSYGIESEARGSIVRVAVKPPYVLGIDLGTSTTCVSYINDIGIKKDIKLNGDKDDEPCMPSVVAFADNGKLLVGKEALAQAIINPLSTIYEVKRLMGQSFYDIDYRQFVYRVRPTLKSHSLKGTRAAIDIPCKGYQNKLLQPEVVSALIIHHVVEIAKKELGVIVQDVILGVPAQFDDAQRKATLDASLIAGLNPKKIVNEPTIAAFAAANFVDDMRGSEDEIKLSGPKITRESVVIDIGGGTSDFSYMQILGSYYKVIATSGNKNLGGRNIDLRLAKIMTEIFKKDITDPGVKLESPTFEQNLRIECEKAKIALSENDSYDLRVKINVANQSDIVLKHNLTRERFENYTDDILNAMLAPLNSLFSGEHQYKEHVRDLYLVGGTVQIPKVQELLKIMFPNATTNYSRDPVQCVSRGAAKFGAIHDGIVNSSWSPYVNIIPLPIKIAIDDNMYTIFNRSQMYPSRKKVKLSTYTNNQTTIVIQVYEGNCLETTNECHFLGKFMLSGIPPLPKGVPKINATFNVDNNGILSVEASYNCRSKSIKNELNLSIYSNTGRMSDKKITELSSLVRKLVLNGLSNERKCSLLENAPPMPEIPPEQNMSNVLKLTVDSEYDGVKMIDDSNATKNLAVWTMVTITGALPKNKNVLSMAELDIVLIIDTSDSMMGNRLSTMKNLIRHLINSTLMENHRLGIVSFNTKARRLFELAAVTEKNKEGAMNIVSQIEAVGDTNTYEGLLVGLRMAYEEGRRACVMLFTDGYPNAGSFQDMDDIVRNIITETRLLKRFSTTNAQVDLHTFGISVYPECQDFLFKLAESVGDGSYQKVDSTTDLSAAFASVVFNAITQIGESIEITITPSSDRVRIINGVTNFVQVKEAESLIIKIPNLADQQSRHIPLELTMLPTNKATNYEEVLGVKLTYKNLITKSVEMCEEYLYTARTREWSEVNLDVIEQRNRAKVAEKLNRTLEYVRVENPDDALREVNESLSIIERSETRNRSLSLCIQSELVKLMAMVHNLNAVELPLKESLKSHWHEEGGLSLCYRAHKENTMITLVDGYRAAATEN